MTIEESIESLSLLKIFNAPSLNEGVKMAISALRAQQAPAKLDRSQWEGCPECSCIVISRKMVNRGRNYCPYCGRPLTEKAWAELERRIGGNNGTTDNAE